MFTYTSPVFAQEIEWQRTIGGSSSDGLYSIQQTTDGGYIFGGISSSSISGYKTESCLGDRDYWIVKTDSTGSIQWQNTIGGAAFDRLNSVEQTNDGGYILGGYSTSNISGDKTEDRIGTFILASDYWIVKIDSLGNILWQNTIGGTRVDELFDIQQTTDGGYILGGHSNSDISGDKTDNCFGNWDYWIVKVNSLGLIQWQNTIGGSQDDRLVSIQLTTDGGCILGGYSESNISGDKTTNSFGDYDYWIVKTDALGNLQWDKTIGGSLEDELTSIEQTNDGGYILCGSSLSSLSGLKTEASKGYYGTWLLKIDSLGNIEWQNTIGGIGGDNINSIRQTADGGFIMGGSSFSNIRGDKTEKFYGAWADFWVLKTDEGGNIIWQNTIGGSGNDVIFSIDNTNDGEYILGGMSQSNISGDKTENCFGDYDYWIIKLTDKYNLITGKLFADFNSNGIQESGEFPLPVRKITEQSTGRFTFSDQNGNYILSVLDTGNFTVSPQSVNWFNPSPVSHTSTFVGIHHTDSSTTLPSNRKAVLKMFV
ncbi:MAG: T9SS C-terminal target domain-containing protein [Bacteroidetes bacterium]|nr:T9SS C-terminal target domain-containing protein [Bacteroidota bacterium]